MYPNMNNWNEENGKYKRYGIDAEEKSQKKLSRRVSKKSPEKEPRT